jgi:hypothetical protein
LPDQEVPVSQFLKGETQFLKGYKAKIPFFLYLS